MKEREKEREEGGGRSESGEHLQKSLKGPDHSERSLLSQQGPTKCIFHSHSVGEEVMR